MTALSIGKGITLNNAEELEAMLRHIGAASSTRARCRPGR
jgi:hypothetical protein